MKVAILDLLSTKLIREATISKNRTNNKAYVEGMLNILSSYDAAIFAIIMDKPTKNMLVSLYKKLHHHTKNTPIPDSNYTEFALQRIGTHYTYNVNINSSLPSRIKEDFLPYFT